MGFLYWKFYEIVATSRCATSWSSAQINHMGLLMVAHFTHMGLLIGRNAYLWNQWTDFFLFNGPVLYLCNVMSICPLNKGLPMGQNAYILNCWKDYLCFNFTGIAWTCSCAAVWYFVHFPHICLPKGQVHWPMWNCCSDGLPLSDLWAEGVFVHWTHCFKQQLFCKFDIADCFIASDCLHSYLDILHHLVPL